MKILVVDDDRDLLEALGLGMQLQWQGAEVVTATDGEQGLEVFAEQSPDVVLLDVGLPRLDGFEVLRRIREVSDTPVLMLTARGEELDKVRGLEIGADDYVTKPFSPLELLARIKAVLRRTELPPPVRAAPSFAAGDLTINFDSREVFKRGEVVQLTALEYRLLYHLVRNAGHVLSREALLARVWGDEYRGQSDYLKVYISRLRSKLEDDPDHPRYILTERGLGYRFSRSPAPSGPALRQARR
ncbi:MAG TPA: response regulator transcription factor [Chloroflexota bacterium]|nr:response regulator transcription factor [Chloroflexota bacterium]